MNKSSVGAFARAAQWTALAAVALLVGAGTLHAQSTGKLEGRVRDQAGAPIPGAQVRIEGTAFNAVADGRGYYFVNNIPSGTVTLLAQFVGYRQVRLSGKIISAGQTITQDFALEQQAIDIGEIEIVGQNALVPRDAVTSKQNISGEYTSKLPVDRIGSVLSLQPGVVTQGDGKITVRGGRTDEASTYIDGVPVSPGNRGGMFVGTSGGTADVSTHGFEDASVTTGASSAEFGNAQSGVIAIQTRSGGSKWSGGLGYQTDAVGGYNHSVGRNAVQGSFGGPLAHNLSFFFSGDLEGNKSASTGLDGQNAVRFLPVGVDTTVAVISTKQASDSTIPRDTTMVDVLKFAEYNGSCTAFNKSPNSGIASNYGYSCRGAQIPLTANSSYRTQAKLQYTYGSGSRIALSGVRSQANARTASYGDISTPQDLFGTWTVNNVVNLNWTQNLSKSADRALALEVYASYQWDRGINGPLSRASEESTRDPFGGFIIKPLGFLFDFSNFPIANIASRFRTNSGALSPYDINATTQYQLTDVYRNNPYGVQGAFLAFNDGGGPTGRLSLYKEDRAIGKANLDWQVDRYNRVKLGGEYTKYFMNSYSSGLTSQAFSDGYHEKPIRWNGFIEDRLDLGDVVLVGGLRYDWYKSGASRPYYTDSLGNSTWFPRISTMPGFSRSDPTAGFVADKSHNYLSPHIQVAFPVTERTNFRLSYAHQVQAPDFALILGGINTDLSVTNTNHLYGSDLDFGRTITFEFGIRHSFNDDAVLDISAYNKDKLSDAAGRLISFYDPLKKQNTDIRVMTNADFGNARGIDIRFDRRIGELFNGSISYTYEQAKNTGSNPQSYINFGSRILNAISGGNNPPPQAIQTTDQNRPHNLAGQLALAFPNNWKQGSAAGTILENVGVFATFRFASGTAYTRCPIGDAADNNTFSGSVCNKNIEGDFNGARLPGVKNFDLRVTKGFKVAAFDFTAYADVRNLFNFKTVNRVFAQTNDIVNTGELNTVRKGELQAFAAEAKKNGALAADSTINLTFGGAGASGCGGWLTDAGASATPNCVYMIRAEQRYGNGDGLFTQAEQTRASDALYYVFRGISSFTDAPRRIRLGFEVNF